MADMLWIEIIYWAATIIGGTLFILRVIMMLIGGGFGDGDVDVPHDLPHDIPHDVHLDGDMHADVSGDHPSANISFKLLSVQGLTSFFMMFGLVGLALLKSNLPILVTVIGATLAGLVTVAVTGLIFSQMNRLQTEGTIRIQNTIGTEGTVYLTIPREGTGQVQVIVQGSLKIFDAVSKEKKMIATGERVQVAGVASGNILIVEKTK
jgi:membrane protein implicated in regulation of membrane protease activity